MDAVGDHALCCHPLGIYNRHSKLRNEFALLCKELGLQVSLKKGPEGSILCPADALVQGLNNSPVAVDFSVVHTLQTSASLADMRPGKLAKQPENRNTGGRSVIFRQEGWKFVPFIMETVGMWGGQDLPPRGERTGVRMLCKQWPSNKPVSLCYAPYKKNL